MKKGVSILVVCIMILEITSMPIYASGNPKYEDSKEIDRISKTDENEIRSTDNDTEKEIIVKFILENTDQTEEITEKDLQLKSIINGSFSEPCKREALYIVKMLHRPHVAGIDSYIGIIVDLETGQPLRYCEFRSDKTELYVLSSENGLCKVLFVGKQESTGSRSYVIKLFSFEKGIEEINMFISPLMFLSVIINSRGFWSLNIA